MSTIFNMFLIFDGVLWSYATNATGNLQMIVSNLLTYV